MPIAYVFQYNTMALEYKNSILAIYGMLRLIMCSHLITCSRQFCVPNPLNYVFPFNYLGTRY